MAINTIGAFDAIDHAPPARRYLVSPRSDPWLLGGIGIAAWLFFSAPSWGALPTLPPVVEGPLYWALIAISGTHFGASYHLAYGQGRHHVRRSGVLLIGVPVALFLTVSAVTIASLSGGVDIANEVTSFLLVVVFTTTTWHYVKQVYGVARVGASLADLRLDPLTTHVLRYGLYPIWLLEAIKIWSGRSGGRFEETRIGYNVLPDFLVSALAWITYGSIAVIAMVFIRLSLRSGRVPATMWTPYVAGFLWILFQPSYASVVLVFGALHGLQYLACAHRAEVAWGKERSAGRPNLWWSSAFGGALATGLLLVYWSAWRGYANE